MRHLPVVWFLLTTRFLISLVLTRHFSSTHLGLPCFFIYELMYVALVALLWTWFCGVGRPYTQLLEFLYGGKSCILC